MKFFDTHTHAQFAAFESDWREVIERALKNNIWLINVGTQKDTSARAVEVANLYSEGVYATVGLHPIHTEKSYHDSQELGGPPAVSFSNSRELENKGHAGFVSRGEEFDYDYYKKLALDPRVVAIGECGLDYYRIKDSASAEASADRQESRVMQEKAFLGQIELAAEVKKPLMIHCRNAFDDLINILKTNISKLKADSPGIIHFFTGSAEDAKKLLGLGFSFTFGGVITFARDYDEAIKVIPLDRILSETDAPYMAPVPYRGKRNEPAYVVEVVKKLAEVKNISIEKTEEQIFENAKNIFNLK